MSERQDQSREPNEISSVGPVKGICLAVIAAEAGANDLYANVIKGIYHEYGKGAFVSCSLGRCGLRLVATESEMVEVLAINCPNFPGSLDED